MYRLAEKNPSFPDQPMYHTIWLDARSDGARLVCHHADSQRCVGCRIYSGLLSAAVSHFIYRGRMGRPVPQEKADHRRGYADRICHVHHGTGHPAYFIRACFAWRPACHVSCPFFRGRNTNTGGQCCDPTARSGTTAHAVQRDQRNHAVCS